MAPPGITPSFLKLAVNRDREAPLSLPGEAETCNSLEVKQLVFFHGGSSELTHAQETHAVRAADQDPRMSRETRTLWGSGGTCM